MEPASTIEPMADPAPEPTRYDALAEGYARHWGPVIRPAAIAVLDLVPDLGTERPRILDVGSGAGTLALAALRRWPAADVVGVDASEAMLAIAERDIGQTGGTGGGRLEIAVATADRLPFADASFDLAISSFVFQLVPSRAAALREARRVLRRGAPIAWVTWLLGGEKFPADEVVNDVFDEFGFDPPEAEGPSGDPASVKAAAAATRRAGFRDVRASAGTLEHLWTPDAYVAFLAEFDEESLFGELESDERSRLERRLLDRLGELTPEQRTMRLPIVYVGGVAG
jgi:SAM-dependent methyltransferase